MTRFGYNIEPSNTHRLVQTMLVLLLAYCFSIHSALVGLFVGFFTFIPNVILAWLPFPLRYLLVSPLSLWIFSGELLGRLFGLGLTLCLVVICDFLLTSYLGQDKVVDFWLRQDIRLSRETHIIFHLLPFLHPSIIVVSVTAYIVFRLYDRDGNICRVWVPERGIYSDTLNSTLIRSKAQLLQLCKEFNAQLHDDDDVLSLIESPSHKVYLLLHDFQAEWSIACVWLDNFRQLAHDSDDAPPPNDSSPSRPPPRAEVEHVQNVVRRFLDEREAEAVTA